MAARNRALPSTRVSRVSETQVPAGRALGQTGYLAAAGYVEQLIAELGEVASVHDRLVLADGPPRPVAWAQNVWHDPVELSIGSIGEGARALRAIQRNWALYSCDHHRRAALVAEKLPHVSAQPLRFPAAPPSAPLGSWSLIDRDTIIAAARCSSPFVNGEPRFVEDRDNPPNRAYLKVWEALTRLQQRPQPGELCLDLGASPGGWTWALHQLGARVISVDKAPLDPRVAALPGVEHRLESAFSLTPSSLGQVDWLFCDMACYPERLLGLVRQWLSAGACRRMLCTIKFQGATDHAVAAEFAAIPGSQLFHLSCNKHELTWALVG